MDFFKRLSNDKQVQCPRCLNMVSIPKNRTNFICENKLLDEHGVEGESCRYNFPDLYVHHYGEAVATPIQVFGWSSHGKTVYVHILRRMLMEMQKVWSDYGYTAISDEDIELSRWLRTGMENGVMPDATRWMRLKDNYIYIMQLDNMVRWDSRFLMVMDHGGEHFETQADLEVHQMPYLTNKETTTLMFISIPMLRGLLVGKEAAEYSAKEREAIKADLEPSKPQRGGHYGRSMAELLTNYVQAMTTYDKQESQRKSGSGFLKRSIDSVKSAVIQQRRKLVIVFTMADVIINELPPRLRDYIIMDDTWDTLFDGRGRMQFDVNYMEKYMDRMQNVSDYIRDWLLSDLNDIGGDQFVKSLESHNIEARYTLVSSLGHNEVSLQGEIRGEVARGMKIAPKRVLDPFFWLLEYQKFGN